MARDTDSTSFYSVFNIYQISGLKKDFNICTEMSNPVFSMLVDSM